MIYIIVATHGNLGTSLVDTALTVLGGDEILTAVGSHNKCLIHGI